LRAEEDTLARYATRVAQAEQAGETAIKLQLENLIVDESTHRDDIRRMLIGWR
jgi:bacterioferritin